MSALESRPSILLIAYHYPPLIHVSSQRSSAFVKYLGEMGFSVEVITLERGEADTPGVHRVRERRFFRRADTYAKSPYFIHKAKAAYNRIRSYFITDEAFGFYGPALKKARELIERKGIRVLITSASPLAPLRIGFALKKEFPNLFWISDLRDPLSTMIAARSKLRATEDRMIRVADRISSVSEPILRELSDRDEPANGRRYLEIGNGYDFAEVTSPESKGDEFNILYAGTFYGPRSPKHFFQAIERLRSRRPEARIRITLLGGGLGILVPDSIRPLVVERDKVPYARLPTELSRASAFLVVIHAGAAPGGFTGKIFDYLAVNRPILALVDPNDVAAKLVRDAKAGYIAPSDDVDAIETLLDRAFSDWEAGRRPERDWDVVHGYRRRNQVEKLGREILGRDGVR